MSDYIPEEIQLKIMKHLPVQTLLRCRCVCKWWKEVIDSQSFVQDHLSTQKPYFILQYEAPQFLVFDPCKLPLYDIFHLPFLERLRLLGTLHGIICLYNSNLKEIILWNPWTCKSMIVGPTSDDFHWYEYDEYEFSLTPSSGFWIDPSTKEFKIIMFQLYDDPHHEQGHVCEMYSSTLGDWKNIPLQEELMFCYTEDLTPAVVIDGVGHWTVYFHCRDAERAKWIGIVVLLFDFVEEVFWEYIEAPGIREGWTRPVVCNRDGILSLVYMDSANSFNVMSWKEGEWVDVHSFFLNPGLEKFIWREEDMEDMDRKFRVVATITGGLLSFKSKDVFFCCPLMMEIMMANDVAIADGYVESLLFPDTD